MKIFYYKNIYLFIKIYTEKSLNCETDNFFFIDFCFYLFVFLLCLYTLFKNKIVKEKEKSLKLYELSQKI
jgi:hypothetical protein